MLQVSINNIFWAWTLAVTVFLILVEAALAIWIYLIKFTTLCWIVFTFNGYRTVKTFFIPGIYYIYILHILIDNIVSGINALFPCERPLLLLVIVYTTFGLFL